MKISVALCTYNGEKYIGQQLDSILNQTVSLDEIVVCDDGSTDNTLAIADDVLSKSGMSYRIEKNEKSLGVANNFLKALKLTEGDYVFTCDQDDVWHKDKVEKFLAAVKASEKELYFSDGVLVDGEGNPLGSTIWQALFVEKEINSNPNMLHILLKHPVVTGAAMLVSRTLIDRVDTIPTGWLHDEWFSVVAALNDSIAPVCEATFDYRQHGKNVVGVRKRNFFQRASFWLSMLEELKDYRHEQNLKKRDIVLAAQGSGYQSVVKESAEFWAVLDGIKDKRFFGRLKDVIRLAAKGWYNKFYTGNRGLLRDLISCFL